MLLPATERRASPAPRARERSRAGAGETILLVEDEAALREVTRRLLTAAGYRVIAAANGREGLSAAGEHDGTIDLLLSDVVMPEMNGPQLAERLLHEDPSLRVLLMSGFAEPILDAGGQLDERVALIEKPFAGPFLLAQIAQLLNREEA